MNKEKSFAEAKSPQSEASLWERRSKTTELVQIRIGAFLNNNVASAHCINISERSTQGVETPCYKSWIATLSLAMTEKIKSLTLCATWR